MSQQSESRSGAFLCRGEGLTMRCPTQCEKCQRFIKELQSVDLHRLGTRLNFADGTWEIVDESVAVEYLWGVIASMRTSQPSETQEKFEVAGIFRKTAEGWAEVSDREIGEESGADAEFLYRVTHG